MILDVVECLPRYESLHRLFPAAIKFLGRSDLADLPDGRHEIDGEDLYAIVARAVGKSAEDAKLEVHNKYIDIQVILKGTDSMGWKSRSECTAAVSDYDPDSDIQFFRDLPSGRVEVHAGEMVVFFPEDAHAPMVSSDLIHKVVVKVAV